MLEQTVIDFFSDVCPARPDDTVLLAVSGGPDSIALLHLMLEVRDTLGVNLEVAHLDHGLRGDEGRRDARFVADLCAGQGLTLHNRRVDLPGILEDEGGSVEAVARRERYAFLNEARAVAGARWIATGHTADDQAETFLMNLMRGSGPRGLGGMLATGPGPVCRPLLGCWREDVMEYLEANEIPFCEDSSNQDLSLTRNRVRHSLVPLLEEEFGTSVIRTLARGSRFMNEVDSYLSLEADRILGEVAIEDDAELDEIRLDVDALLGHPAVMERSVLRAALEELVGGLEGIHLGHIDALLELAGRREGSGQIDLPQGLTARREYEHLVLSRDVVAPKACPEASPPLDLGRKGELRWGRFHLRWAPTAASSMDPESLAAGPDQGLFDHVIADSPVYLRAVQPGDRLEPSGMTGTQKVSDLFINRKVPRHLRTWIPLLCDNGGSEDGERILWVVGQRRSRHAPVVAETSQVVWFEAEPIL